MTLHLWTDGGVTHNRADNPGPATAAFVVKDVAGNYLGSKSFALTGTNNIAEWYGVIEALRWLREGAVAWSGAVIHCDSKLIVSQFNGEWKIKDARMRNLYHIAKDVRDELDFFWGMATLMQISLVRKTRKPTSSATGRRRTDRRWILRH